MCSKNNLRKVSYFSDVNQQQQVAWIFDKHADWYVERFMDVSLYAASLDRFLEFIPAKNARLMDLGCGPGNVTRYLLNQRPDLQITGVDLAPAMIDLAQKHNPDATFLLSGWQDALEKSHDLQGVVAAFIFPYLSEDEVKNLLQTAAKSLVSDGVLYISTMEDDYAASGLKTNSSGDQVNMYYYTEKQLEVLLNLAGFRVSSVDRKTYEYNGSEVTDLLLVATKTD